MRSAIMLGAAVAAFAAGPAWAGGTSADTARQAMCEDALGSCVAVPLEAGVCAGERATLACVLARVKRDTSCLRSYDFCLAHGGFPMPETKGGKAQ